MTAATTTTASATATTPTARKPVWYPWTRVTQWLHGLIKTVVVKCSMNAAKYPERYIAVLPAISIGLLVAGYLTNFRLELDTEAILSPTGSQPALNRDWVVSDEGFPNKVREVAMLFHKQGENVLTMDAMERVFQSVETVLQTEGYEELCQQGSYINFEGEKTCRFLSATGYFEGHKLESFQEQIQSDEELRQALSPTVLANGSPVYHNAIFGNWEMNQNGTLTFAQSYLVLFFLPDIEEADAFEEKVLDQLDELRTQWIDQDEQSGKHVMYMDMLSLYGIQAEYQRAITSDLYLIAVVAVIMCSFLAITFFSFGLGHEKAKSRTLLGSASVYTITMSYIAGNGLMFLCGVPFTPVTQILPYIVFGVGLDDTFIITGAYLRNSSSLEILERIHKTMDEVAHSISLTTITTIFAFLLGLKSSLPGVQWLSLYAFTTIAIDFYFQITLYIAFVVLDERRIQNGKRDVCFCLSEKDTEKDTPTEKKKTEPESSVEQPDTVPIEDEESNNNNKIIIPSVNNEAESTTHIASIQERLVSQYADFLLKPTIKACVLVLFAALLACCIYSTTLLRQEFKMVDFVPEDSYIKNVTYALTNYASVVRPIAVYFRNVDQTNPDIQEQMINYVNDLEALDQVSSIEVDATHSGYSAQVKPFCWVRDAQEIAGAFDELPMFAFVQNLSFVEKLDLALANPTVRELYAQDIIRDETGNITASRCWLFLTDLDLDSVEEQVDLLHEQREVGAAQPINQGKAKDEWSFFFYDDVLFYWESYDVAVRELIFTIRDGIIAMTVIALVMIPHWSAVFFVTPMIAMLYVNFLGTLRFFGLQINGVFYFCVLVSIGLLVDFLLHILLRYYETSASKSRDERVKETLVTMGTSILLGGLTTFLGVVPLCFSKTKIFMIVFKSFFTMVVLGIVHGLVLLPVILSLVGPNSGLVSLNRGPSKDEDGSQAPDVGAKGQQDTLENADTGSQS